MNIVFWALVILLAFGAWFSLSSSFWNIGAFFSGVWNDAKDALKEERDKEEDEENE